MPKSILWDTCSLKAISKVVFQLHASFPQPTRELTEPPFEITETGWGEFEAQIRIFWNESSDERSTLVNHGIRLYPNRAPATALNPSQFMNTTVPGELYHTMNMNIILCVLSHKIFLCSGF